MWSSGTRVSGRALFKHANSKLKRLDQRLKKRTNTLVERIAAHELCVENRHVQAFLQKLTLLLGQEVRQQPFEEQFAVDCILSDPYNKLDYEDPVYNSVRTVFSKVHELPSKFKNLKELDYEGSQDKVDYKWFHRTVQTDQPYPFDFVRILEVEECPEEEAGTFRPPFVDDFDFVTPDYTLDYTTLTTPHVSNANTLFNQENVSEGSESTTSHGFLYKPRLKRSVGGLYSISENTAGPAAECSEVVTTTGHTFNSTTVENNEESGSVVSKAKEDGDLINPSASKVKDTQEALQSKAFSNVLCALANTNYFRKSVATVAPKSLLSACVGEGKKAGQEDVTALNRAHTEVSAAIFASDTSLTTPRVTEAVEDLRADGGVQKGLGGQGPDPVSTSAVELADNSVNTKPDSLMHLSGSLPDPKVVSTVELAIITPEPVNFTSKAWRRRKLVKPADSYELEEPKVKFERRTAIPRAASTPYVHIRDMKNFRCGWVDQPEMDAAVCKKCNDNVIERVPLTSYDSGDRATEVIFYPEAVEWTFPETKITLESEIVPQHVRVPVIPKVFRSNLKTPTKKFRFDNQLVWQMATSMALSYYNSPPLEVPEIDWASKFDNIDKLDCHHWA